MLVKDALKITDSFTKTSKMPGLSYSLPAWECKTGLKLAACRLKLGPSIIYQRAILIRECRRRWS